MIRILIIWDDPAEANEIAQSLKSDLSKASEMAVEAEVAVSEEEIAGKLASGEQWDLVLLNVSWKDPETGFRYFESIRQHHPHAGIVGACFAREIFQTHKLAPSEVNLFIARDLTDDFPSLICHEFREIVKAVEAERKRNPPRQTDS